MPPDFLLPAISPLRVIFWGGLLCVFDLSFSQTTNGHGFRFDVLNDALGMGMIVWGVSSLKWISIGSRYEHLLWWVHVVAVLAFVEALLEHFIMPVPPPVQLVAYLFGLAKLAAVIAFCVAMQWFCEAAWFPEVAQSWNVSKWLYVVIYAVPTGLLQIGALAALARGRSISLNFGPATILLLALALVPLIHLFVSIRRTIGRLENLTKPKL